MDSTGPMGQVLSSRVAPLLENFLQGSVLDTSKDVLIHRLRGLCDNAENQPEIFHDHEIVFIMQGNPNQQPMYFHVRHSLIHPESWHVRYLGVAEVGDKNKLTLIRHCVDAGASSNVVDFLNEMGFKIDYEFIAKGYFFHKGRMKVTVSKLYKILQPGSTDQVEPLSQSHLVELSVVAPRVQEQIGEDMKNFAEQLKPLVLLEKIDHKRLQQSLESR
ncbi:hypothetical protein CHS0354_005860 [Potamilus streckersoni]|uniref:Mediator of RNA polymerase II transcription subunit 18 n=1 Tax=Potamilus streckersoni TaxID=2493646 RepID=A0AAE0T887_9BIVA|nr:hypothetical protein CHS0354_005860 [Potamilus streckersoni]